MNKQWLSWWRKWEVAVDIPMENMLNNWYCRPVCAENPRTDSHRNHTKYKCVKYLFIYSMLFLEHTTVTDRERIHCAALFEIFTL